LKWKGWTQGTSGNKAIDATDVWWNKKDLLLKVTPHIEGAVLLRAVHHGFVFAPMGIATTQVVVPLVCYPMELEGKMEKVRTSANKATKSKLLKSYFDRVAAYIEHLDLLIENELYYLEVPDDMKAAFNTAMKVKNEKLPVEAAAKRLKQLRDEKK